MMILAAAAAITLLLGAIGLYGVIAYVVTLRTRELGLRLALGAEPRGVLALVLRDGVEFSLIGVVGGLVAFAAVARFLKGFLFGVSAADPLTLSVVIVTLILVAGVASAIPAWRASRISIRSRRCGRSEGGEALDTRWRNRGVRILAGAAR